MTRNKHQNKVVAFNSANADSKLTAQDWYDKGERLPFNFTQKHVLVEGDPVDLKNSLFVFRRVTQNTKRSDASLTTFLPGFPDGSFGFASIDRLLPDEQRMPRLFLEYIGQGDSDKPAGYAYSIMDRADQVEAHWRALNIKSTFVVAFDYSVIVMLELLSRQQDRVVRGEPPVTKIEGVLLINGGLFADGHSHPWFTTPLLNTPFGRIGTWFAQRSRFVFGELVSSLWSKEYNVKKLEVDEMFDAITRRNGARFLSDSAGFVGEHKKTAKRWNLKRLYDDMKDEVSFHVVGSDNDPFEGKQAIKAKKRLGKAGLDVRVLPGGHLSTAEQPEKLAAIIVELIEASKTEPAARRA